MSDNTTHPVHTPEDCPTYHDGCNCRERIATLETRVEVEVELRKASYERIAKLEAENARLWSALVKACDDAWTEDPHMARRYHEEANP